ncbi:hypothetical protein EXN66_Car009357 [Channa argus]|uniref:Uncharacterized protein n=1 Tax=Channa argus TaxID=215402 RepID=A0A6G1PTM1_CHAAH|nr:hypothetical protein EXN66_Car009357 [Channa argus]
MNDPFLAARWSYNCVLGKGCEKRHGDMFVLSALALQEMLVDVVWSVVCGLCELQTCLLCSAQITHPHVHISTP